MQLGKFKIIRERDQQWKSECGKVRAFIDKHVERVLEEQASRDASGKPKPKISSDKPKPERYILLNEVAKVAQDPIDLRNQLLNVFFPAHDATAITIADMMFHFARDMNVQTKLRSEIAAVGSAQLSFELLKSMRYLRFVFNESE